MLFDENMRNEFIKKLHETPDETLAEISKQEIEASSAEYDEFYKMLNKRRCYLCGYNINHLAKNKVCLHWLLFPTRFKKNKHFKSIYEKFNYHQIDAYLKWLANSEKPFINISNLREEQNPTNVIEHTIKYKEFEWSFHCGPGDLLGHNGGTYGTVPHYHFQTKLNGLVVISFGEFHIPFQEYDLFMIDVKAGKFGEKIQFHPGLGSGIQEFFDLQSDEELLGSFRDAGDDMGADFRIQTLMQRKDGGTISSKDILDMITEQEKTGESIAKISKTHKDLETKIFVTSQNTPEISKRKPRKR